MHLRIGGHRVRPDLTVPVGPIDTRAGSRRQLGKEVIAHEDPYRTRRGGRRRNAHRHRVSDSRDLVGVFFSRTRTH
jgi:hypothetical protein